MIIHKQIFVPYINNYTNIDLPKGAKILTIKLVNNEFTIWYSFDDFDCLEEMAINVVYCLFTGVENSYPDIGKYITTIIKDGLVYHFYRCKYNEN